MKDLHLILNQEYEDMIASKLQDIEIFKKFSRGNLQILLYNLGRGAAFFEDKIEHVDGIKTYWILSGALKNVESKKILKVGDMFIMDHEHEILHFEAIEDSQIIICGQMENVFDGWLASENDILNILFEIQIKDSYTEEHCNNVFKYATLVAQKCGLISKQLYYLNKAARFHDIGKMYVEDYILNKPGKLSSDEYQEMTKHVSLGKELICKYFQIEIFNIIEQHHERLDGSGYPKGLKGDSISLSGRILAVCDSYDAMITDRVYKKGKSKIEAVSELRSLSGIKLDGMVVESLIEVLQEMGELEKD